MDWLKDVKDVKDREQAQAKAKSDARFARMTAEARRLAKEVKGILDGVGQFRWGKNGWPAWLGRKYQVESDGPWTWRVKRADYTRDNYEVKVDVAADDALVFHVIENDGDCSKQAHIPATPEALKEQFRKWFA